jgi:hypothetical protein
VHGAKKKNKSSHGITVAIAITVYFTYIFKKLMEPFQVAILFSLLQTRQMALLSCGLQSRERHKAVT